MHRGWLFHRARQGLLAGVFGNVFDCPLVLTWKPPRGRRKLSLPQRKRTAFHPFWATFLLHLFCAGGGLLRCCHIAVRDSRTYKEEKAHPVRHNNVGRNRQNFLLKR